MATKEDKLLADFLIKKETLLEKFSNYINVEKLLFNLEELSEIENKAKTLLDVNDFSDLYNIYIGEIIIKFTGGMWSIGKLKKDLAYHKPIVLRPDGNRMRLCPMVDWFGLLKKDRLENGISGMVKTVINYGKLEK